MYTWEEKVHVVFAADDNYAESLSVAMASAALNTQNEMVFHIIVGNMLEVTKKRIIELFAGLRPDLNLLWYDAPKFLENCKVVNNSSWMTYARLLIPDILSNDIGTALYLDSDVVVLDDLSKLWCLRDCMNGKDLMAVRDRVVGKIGAPKGVQLYTYLNIPGEAKYFNSGVMLMDLNGWRAKRIGHAVLGWAEHYRWNMNKNDQEALNAVLWRDWEELPFKWNYQLLSSIPGEELLLYWQPDLSKKSIVHFTSIEKPWLPNCQLEEKAHYEKYLNIIGWRN